MTLRPELSEHLAGATTVTGPMLSLRTFTPCLGCPQERPSRSRPPCGCVPVLVAPSTSATTRPAARRSQTMCRVRPRESSRTLREAWTARSEFRFSTLPVRVSRSRSRPLPTRAARVAPPLMLNSVSPDFRTGRPLARARGTNRGPQPHRGTGVGARSRRIIASAQAR